MGISYLILMNLPATKENMIDIFPDLVSSNGKFKIPLSFLDEIVYDPNNIERLYEEVSFNLTNSPHSYFEYV